MSVGTDADVQIGSVRCRLAYDQDNFYAPEWSPRPVTRNDIPGSPGDENLQPDLRVWRITDWSGGEVGEQNSFFDAQDPSAYDTGQANTRIPGQFSGPPARTGGTPTATGTAPTFGPFLTNCSGFSAINHYGRVEVTTDGSTWTAKTSGVSIANGQATCQPCSDGRYLYEYFHDTPHSTGTFEVRRADLTASSTSQVATDGPARRDALGLETLAGYLYVWTGARLRRWDISVTTSWPYANYGTEVHVVTADGTFPATYYGGLVKAGGALAYFYSAEGETILYEFRNEVGAELARFPNGFVARSMCFYLGDLWLIGSVGTEMALYKYSYELARGQFVNTIRRGTALTPTCIAPGQNDQLLISAHHASLGEYIFVYSVDLEAVSLLDIRTGDGTCNAVIGYKNLRLAAMGQGSTTLKTSSWVDDAASTTVTGNVTSSEWDYDLPEEQGKVLWGFFVSYKPITGSETIVVKYGVDGAAATTTTAGTITSASTGAATGKTFVAVSTGSSTVTFATLRYDTTVTGGAVVKAVAPVMYPIRKLQRFRLVLDLRDNIGADSKRAWQNYIDLFGETYNASTNPKQPNQSVTGILATNNVVTFLNGWPYPDGDQYDTYTAVVERASYEAVETGGGFASVVLRILAA